VWGRVIKATAALADTKNRAAFAGGTGGAAAGLGADSTAFSQVRCAELTSFEGGSPRVQ
jgi:hypothetical protein